MLLNIERVLKIPVIMDMSVSPQRPVSFCDLPTHHPSPFFGVLQFSWWSVKRSLCMRFLPFVMLQIFFLVFAFQFCYAFWCTSLIFAIFFFLPFQYCLKRFSLPQGYIYICLCFLVYSLFFFFKFLIHLELLLTSLSVSS